MSPEGGARLLGLALTLMVLGLCAVVVGVATPLWETANHTTIGLFRTCTKGSCYDLDQVTPTLQLVRVYLLVGILAALTTIIITCVHVSQRNRRAMVNPELPAIAALLSYFGGLFTMAAGIIYALLIGDERPDYSYFLSPWLVFPGFFVIAIGGFLVSVSPDMKLFHVTPYEVDESRQQKPPEVELRHGRRKREQD